MVEKYDLTCWPYSYVKLVVLKQTGKHLALMNAQIETYDLKLCYVRVLTSNISTTMKLRLCQLALVVYSWLEASLNKYRTKLSTITIIQKYHKMQ